MDNEPTYDLYRFIQAQESDYPTALNEIQNGRKQSHWIWYIFPQLKGLGRSSMSNYYGIVSTEEAKAYLAHPILGPRLREISSTLLIHQGKHTIGEIVGAIDAIKLRSCMTLFNLVAPNDIFAQVLDVFYEGIPCPNTLKMTTK